jgi:hypothetical protein
VGRLVDWNPQGSPTDTKKRGGEPLLPKVGRRDRVIKDVSRTTEPPDTTSIRHCNEYYLLRHRTLLPHTLHDNTTSVWCQEKPWWGRPWCRRHSWKVTDVTEEDFETTEGETVVLFFFLIPPVECVGRPLCNVISLALICMFRVGNKTNMCTLYCPNM